jgi:hypothetical protein
MSTLQELSEKAIQYAAERDLQIIRFLGYGNDGAVWETSQQTAIKVLERESSYNREKERYLRLKEHSLSKIDGFEVPDFYDSDDELQIVEVSMIYPPFVIDFAKAYVDQEPDFSDEVMQDWQ